MVPPSSQMLKIIPDSPLSVTTSLCTPNPLISEILVQLKSNHSFHICLQPFISGHQHLLSRKQLKIQKCTALMLPTALRKKIQQFTRAYNGPTPLAHRPLQLPYLLLLRTL